MKKSRITIRTDKKTIAILKECAKKHHASLSYICNEAIRDYLTDDRESKIFERDKKFKKNLIYEINRYGNNINQIAYRLNVAVKSEDLTVKDILSLREAVNNLAHITNGVDEIFLLVSERL